MTIAKARNGRVELAYDTLGPPEGEPLLLIMGTGGQLISWPEGFCQLLTERGFRVARFDNRDAGESTHFTDAGRPNQLKMLLKPAAAAIYSLDDMADDAVAVMDALGWSSAHVLGMSQGGMIAQTLAVTHPDRVRTLTSLSSAPGARVGQPGLRELAKIVKVANPKRVRTGDELGEYLIDLHSIAGSPTYPADEKELRELGRRAFERGGLNVADVQRQTAALAAAGDRRAALAAIKAPTLVLHGEADRLIRVEAARATTDAIPGARLVTYPGMGHDLPRELWPAIIDEISALTRRDGQRQG